MNCLIEAWDAYHRELLRFVAKRIPVLEDAHDLVQEVFLRASCLEKGLCGIDNRRAWLFQITRNLLVDRYRLNRDELALDEARYAIAEPDELPPVEALSQCLPRVLTELSAEDREAITLCDIEGLSRQDFAARKNLSLAAAKSRVLRARARLRKQLVMACQVRFDESGQVCCFVPRPPLAK